MLTGAMGTGWDDRGCSGSLSQIDGPNMDAENVGQSNQREGGKGLMYKQEEEKTDVKMNDLGGRMEGKIADGWIEGKD